MMLVLGIETATSQVGVAIGGHEGVIASFHSTRDRRHAETLAPAIKFVSEQAAVDLDEISVVAVDVGPGLFTGLRVGLASAKAIAHALSVPMIPVGSLDLVAFPARWSQRAIVATVDARRGEIFHCLYRRVPGGIQRFTEVEISTPDELSARLEALGEDVLLIGGGAERYAEAFEDLHHVELGPQALRYPDAGRMVELAHAQALREEFVPVWELEAVYVRAPDAEVNYRLREPM
jgi:tRNA threonylcarbamoyladenosine biosynthesis protein TsaB